MMTNTKLHMVRFVKVRLKQKPNQEERQKLQGDHARAVILIGMFEIRPNAE